VVLAEANRLTARIQLPPEPETKKT